MPSLRVPWRPLAAVLLLGVLWSFTPPADPPLRLCGFHWLTGLPCPLCGLTRGLFALAKGRFHQAVAFNALSPLGMVMLCSLLWNHPARARLWSLGIGAFLLYGVCRIFIPAI